MKKDHRWSEADVAAYEDSSNVPKGIPVIDIGIDPGKNVGVAVLEVNSSPPNWIVLKTMAFWPAAVMLRSIILDTENYYVRKAVVEDPRLIPCTYRRNSAKDSEGVIDMKAQGVGNVKENARLWCEFFEHYGVKVKKVRPGAVPTKLSKSAFSRRTGTDVKTAYHACEHGRDAGCLLIF